MTRSSICRIRWEGDFASSISWSTGQGLNSPRESAEERVSIGQHLLASVPTFISELGAVQIGEAEISRAKERAILLAAGPVQVTV